ncbi:MAG: hypothetical protein CMN77_13565 [Spirochaetaceae bacterium]|nr:hypothetical protein [Spirochaetaceae bacterium]
MKALRKRFAYSIVRDRADSFEFYSWRRFRKKIPWDPWRSWGQACIRVLKKLWLAQNRQIGAARKDIWFNTMRTETDRLRHMAIRESGTSWKNSITRNAKLIRESISGTPASCGRLWVVRCALETTSLNKLPAHPSAPKVQIGPGPEALRVWDYCASSDRRWALCLHWNMRRPQFRGKAQDLIWHQALLRMRVALDGSVRDGI